MTSKKVFFFSILLIATLTTSLAYAQSGWKAEEPIQSGIIDARSSTAIFDNTDNNLIAAWDNRGGGGGYSIRPHLGPAAARTGPSVVEYFSIANDNNGIKILAYEADTWRTITAATIVPGNTPPRKIQEFEGPKRASGRTVDVHLTKNGLGAIIWVDDDGRPNVAFRGSGTDAEFDIANKVILDEAPSNATGGVFIVRDLDGGAFASWSRDGYRKQAYYNPLTGVFDVKSFNSLIPLGEPPVSDQRRSGEVIDLKFGKNNSGDVVVAYAITTSIKGQSVEPHNSISLVYAYRKGGTAAFGDQTTYGINPDNQQDLNIAVAVMPSGKAVVSWTRTESIPNPCTDGVAGPYINGPQQFRSIISNEDGGGWGSLYVTSADGISASFNPMIPQRVAVADGKVIFGLRRNNKRGQCDFFPESFDFSIVNASWPDNQPAFAPIGEGVSVPGLNGSRDVTPRQYPYFNDLASIAVSDIGTVAVLASKRASAGADDEPSLFVWESGLSPGAIIPGTGTATPTPVPENDACPNDAKKTVAGICGCGFEEIDSNGDAVIDCGSPGSIHTRGAILTNPPKVTSNGKNLNLVMQVYEQVIAGKATAMGKALIADRASSKNSKNKGGKGGGKKPKITTVYEVYAKLQGSKAKCGKVKLVSKKNTAQLKNLLNGTYDISYKMIFKQGGKKGKVIGKTSSSPVATGTVTSGKTKCPKPKKKK